jgi:Zn-dependent protease
MIYSRCMRGYTTRDWFVLALIGMAVLYALDPNILHQPGSIDQVLKEKGLRLLLLAVGITVHEFGHAATANFLGDLTPKNEGRVSLNPLRHLDVFGTLMILFGPIGWGKPVRWNPGNVRRTNIRVALIAVSLAGIVMNLLLATSLYQLDKIGLLPWSADVLDIVAQLISLNIALAAFNVLPIPPLDGYQFWLGVLPPGMARFLLPLNQYGFLILLLLVMLPTLHGPNILGTVMRPVFRLFGSLVTGVF